MGTERTGRVIRGDYYTIQPNAGVRYNYAIYIPAVCEGRAACALHVSFDGLKMENVDAGEILMSAGEMPPTVFIGLAPGQLISPATGTERRIRMANYDMFTATYPDFLVDEMLPAVFREHGIDIDPSPDMHMVSGGSSGGIAAWNMAWQRTDFFRRVYMSSPSFLSMGKGEQMQVLMRKVETKPIRVWTEMSENEPDEYFGSSYCVALEAERALRYAGYDMECRYYPGEGHCSRHGNKESAVERMRFLWKNWDTEPVRPLRLSCRAGRLISLDSPWEKTDRPFPKKVPAVSVGTVSAPGTYYAENGTIFFRDEAGESRVVSEGYGEITALAISSDRQRLYIADKTRAYICYSMICSDGSLQGDTLLAVLHLDSEFRVPGAFDLCVSNHDRIYTATECGIQSVRSFGLIDVILPLPDRQIADEISFGEGEEKQYLYARAGETVYRRLMKEDERLEPDEVGDVHAASYYD